MQGSLGSLCAHVALRTRALDPEAAMTAAAAALGGGDLDLNTLEGMEPERKYSSSSAPQHTTSNQI